MIRRCFLVLVLVACLLPTQGADKYTDENRPYEFGFNIEGEQHRKEKKDENGIIMGEFGFITADGVYHVTVYATDENGNFKILSMKNIRVKPYPTAGERQGHSLALPPAPAQPAVQQPNLPASVQARQPAPAPPPAQKPIAIEPPGKSCSHCSIPTPRPPQPAVQQNPNYNTPAQNYPQQHPQNPPQGSPQYNQQAGIGGPQYNQQAGVGGPQYNQQAGIGSPQYNQQAGLGGPQYNQGFNAPSGSQNLGGQQGGVQGSFGSAPSDPQTPGQRNPKAYEPAPQQQFDSSPVKPGINSRFGSPNQPSKPMLISAQMQIVDKNTDIYNRKPGEKEGLPNGITKNDMTLLLYTFNYTVGFHGHHEEGYTNGAKKGYYYVTGRNGVRTRVDYEADENGFRPKITQEVLDLVSDDVPKPDTEKDEKYGLKGYEFKWIYYPENSRQR